MLKVEHRLRLNRWVQAAALGGGLVLLALITWRVLAWLARSSPAATALVVLMAIVIGVCLLLFLAQGLFRHTADIARAASEADQRGNLHDELASALWFMGGDADRRPVARPWIDAQLQRAARTAGGLQAGRLVPLRLPTGLLAGLLIGVVVLGMVWRAAPLTPAHALPAAADETTSPPDAQVNAMRRLIDALPQSEARRRLEAALQTLARGNLNAEERHRAMAQAQQAVDQIKLDAAAGREGLQKLSQILAGQQGMEQVAEALALGDAQRAAELIAKAQAADAGSGSTQMPPDAQGEKPAEVATQKLASGMTEAQGARPNAESLEATAERLKQIARELKAASFVNEAWQQVRGPEQDGARGGVMAAGRHEQMPPNDDGKPSAGSSDRPMGGGTRLRPAAVGQGPGAQEQDGGTRMGNAIGDGKVDPLLGQESQKLEAQFKQHAMQGQEEAQQNPEQEWFYADSQKSSARMAWRTVNARARYAEAQGESTGGIAVKHRQVTRDFFTKRIDTGAGMPRAAQESR